MKAWYTTGCAAALLGVMAGCSQAPPPAPDTRAADEKAIRDGEVSWVADYASKNIDKVMSHYADDATLMIPGMATMKGKEAILSGLKEFLADKNMSLKFTTATVEVARAGDLAYTQGTYSLTATDPKTRKPTSEQGKYVTVYKKQVDGSWRAVEDINNADPPPAAPARKSGKKKR